MVHFILGRAGSGKSALLAEQAGQSAVGEKRITYVIVPEQFTFETERNYYRLHGAAALRNIRVTSFSRIVHNIFKEFGGAAGDYADESIKLILMNSALIQVRDTLQVYGKSAQHVHFSRNMLEMVTELKHADVDPLRLEETTAGLPDSILKVKSQDILHIYSAYEALLSAHYKDSLDDLTRALVHIKAQAYFASCHLYIDEFKSFTAKELELIQVMAMQADKLTFSLCTDHVLDHENSLFATVNETYAGLKNLCRRAGARIAAPVVLDTAHRFSNDALAHLEANVFRTVPKRFSGENEQVHAVLAGNEYDEADFVAATMRALAEQGVRYSDMVAASRDLPSYQSCLETAFEKYKIPYYMDTLKSISASPLIRFIELVFDCILSGYHSDHMIALLKCGLCGVSHEETAQLENYVFLWDIRGKQWKEDFTHSIFGIRAPETAEEATQNSLTLLGYNETRSRLVTALERMRRSCDGKTVSHICSALIHLLEELGVRGAINEKIDLLQRDAEKSEALARAQEYKRVWEITGELLDVLVRVAGDLPISLKRFQELFTLLCSEYDMGTIPQSLDCVTVGSAERMRTGTPKVLFLLGANDKVFPYIPESGGLLTDQERRQLLATGMELSRPLKERIREEKFVAYKTLAMPSDRIYITARKTDVKGTEKAPSYLFPQLQAMFGEEVLSDLDDMERLYFCRTKQTAFAVLANQFRQDTPFTASLREYFSHESDYAGRMESIARSLNRGQFALHDLENAKALYGKGLSMSPTRVEDYHKCRFLYFCRHGMRIYPRQKIRLTANNRGSIIHDILYRVCRKITDFSVFDEQGITTLIRQAFDEYLDASLGGESAQTKRFLYLYERISGTILSILKQLFEELAQSKFRPADFEYEIGGEGNVKPLALQTSDGIRLYINGKVDRIDVYDAEDGTRYVRVIDYKSGKKTFQLSDLVNGVNLQMFIYLLCLQENGEQYYQDAKGAGVLYMPASDPEAKLDRDAGEDTAEQSIQKHYRMHGVVLDDEEVIRAMEEDLSGHYIPVEVKADAYDKDRGLKENVFIERRANEDLFKKGSMNAMLSAEQLGKLFTHLEQDIIQMAEELYQGRIEAKPLKGKTVDPCAYCDYRTICGNDGETDITPYQEMDKKELLKMLEEERNQD